VSVLRRYRDFKWLYDELCRTSGGVIVPAIPDKQIIGNLSAGMFHYHHHYHHYYHHHHIIIIVKPLLNQEEGH